MPVKPEVGGQRLGNTFRDTIPEAISKNRFCDGFKCLPVGDPGNNGDFFQR
jgi:hypothetical protein